MKLKMVLVIVVLIVVCVFVALKIRSGSKEVEDQSEEEVQLQEEQTTTLNKTDDQEQNIPSQEETKVVTKQTTTQKKQSGSSNYKKPFNSSPNPSEYEEKLDNSLVLDSRLRPFAHDMAESMSEAKTDKTKAPAVFDKFKICAEADSTQEIFAVRASCAENLRTLSKLYPDLFEKEYAEIEQRFPEDIKKSLF